MEEELKNSNISHIDYDIASEDRDSVEELKSNGERSDSSLKKIQSIIDHASSVPYLRAL
jgi:hypothetical protein